jgi:hypothetical protein
MDFITDAECATFLGVTADATLTRIRKAVESDFMKACGRTFERVARTSYLAGYGPRVDFIFLPEWPILAVAEVRIDSSGELGSDTAVADLVPFKFDTGGDDPRLIYSGGYFPEGRRTVMVAYTAGYYAQSDADGSHASGKPPEDLRDKLIEEVVVRYRRGASEQFQSAGVSGGENFARFREGRTGAFRDAVRRYRRVA